MLVGSGATGATIHTLVLSAGSLRIGTKVHDLPHPGRHDVDLGADDPFGN